MQAITITQITASELETLLENSLKKVLSSHKLEKELPEKDELLTVKDTAKFLSLSVPTIYGLIHRGELPVMKRSKRCYFSKTELLDYLKEGRRKTVSEATGEVEAYLSNKKERRLK